MVSGIHIHYKAGDNLNRQSSKLMTQTKGENQKTSFIILQVVEVRSFLEYFRFIFHLKMRRFFKNHGKIYNLRVAQNSEATKVLDKLDCTLKKLLRGKSPKTR